MTVTVTIDGRLIESGSVEIKTTPPVKTPTKPTAPPVKTPTKPTTPPVKTPTKPKPPVKPPAKPPIKFTGSTRTWGNVTGGYKFGTIKSFQKAVYIPRNGLAIKFRVPGVTSFGAAFQFIEMRSLPCPLNFSLSKEAGDMVGFASARLVNYDAILSGGYPGRGGMLVPGRDYYLNAKWEKSVNQYVYLSHAYKSPM